MKKLCLILAVLALLVSCENKNRKYLDDFNTVMSEKQGDELFSALLELDARYPDKLRAKINLAALSFEKGDSEKAVSFLEKGLELAGKSSDSDEKYFFYANYAEYQLQGGKIAESIQTARNALENVEEDPMGVSLTLAKGLAADKKYSEALQYFKISWEKNRDYFSENDLNAFIAILGFSQNAQEEVPLMVSIIDEMRMRNPMLQGTGFKQAEILEQAGAPLSALAAAFSEIEFARYSGNLDSGGVMKTLDMLSANIKSESGEKDLASKKMIEGYRSFVLGQWNIAEAAFAEVTPEVQLNFYDYLRLASMLQSGLGNDQVVLNFAMLERYYSPMQGYYYHLWNGMKKGSVKYNAEMATGILMNCILLSPFTDYARESRIELGSLHGIQDGGKIVLVDEVFHYINNVITGGASPDTLEPVAAMLEMEDNVFIKDALELLKEAFVDSRIAGWFHSRAEKGNSRIRERINAM